MEEILRSLHNRYHTWWIRLSTSITHNYQESQDIVLRAYTKAWEKRETLLDIAAIKVFIETTVKNMSIDFTRSQKVNYRRIELIDDIEKLDSPNDDLEEFFEEENKFKKLYDFIFSIITLIPAEKRRDVMVLTMLGYSTQEISGIMNTTTSTVYNQKMRAMKDIKKHLLTNKTN